MHAALQHINSCKIKSFKSTCGATRSCRIHIWLVDSLFQLNCHNFVSFLKDDISLQLNQSDSRKATAAQNSKQPLKHPMMRIKQPQNRFQPPIEVNKKQSNSIVQHQEKSPEIVTKLQSDPNLILTNESQKKKALKFRENQLSQDVESRRDKIRGNGEPVMEGFEDVEAGGNYNEIMNKISMMNLPRQFKLNPGEIVRYLIYWINLNFR